MKLNKVGFIIISLSSVFFVPSCSQPTRMTYDQALAWVTKHYTEEGSATPKSGYRYFDFSKTFGTNTRKFVKDYIEEKFSDYGIILDDNLICDKPMGKDELRPQTYLTPRGFAYTYKGKDAVFNVYNGILTVAITVDANSDTTGKRVMVNQYNKKGAILVDETDHYYIKTKDFDDGAIIGSQEISYKY